MKKVFINLTISLLGFGCTNNMNNLANGDSSKSEIKNIEKMDSMNKVRINFSDAIPDFLKLSQNANEESFGNLQGVNISDSAGPYMRRAFYSDTLSFELLFYPKDEQKKSVNFGSIKKEYKENDYKDFVCFVFVYPMVDPDKAKDYHADNTPYPVKVKSYVRKNGSWNYISSKKAKNLTELSNYEIDVMYSNLK